MAFCSNCGEKLVENSKFCVKCGNAVNTLSVLNTPQQAGAFDGVTPEQMKVNKNQSVTALRFLSILGIVLLPIICLISVATAVVYLAFPILSLLFFGYMIAHTIVALIQGFKNKIMPLKIMSIIGILLYVWFGGICVFYGVDLPENINDKIYNDIFYNQFLLFVLPFMVLGFGYWLAFAIVTIKKSKIMSQIKKN
jgi:hypothetical protein